MKLLEPDVTLTDFALAIECIVLSIALATAAPWGLPYQIAFVLFFACNGIASLAGGLAHGFYSSHSQGAGQFLWRVSLLALGASIIAIWKISAQLLFGPVAGNYAMYVAGGAFVIYASFLLLRNAPFSWAVIFYLPAVLFMLTAFVISYTRSGQPEMLYGLAGTILTLAAAVIQQAGIKLHPRYFNHNALYHLVQAVALLMIFMAARKMILY